jgi:hypothetical protein
MYPSNDQTETQNLAVSRNRPIAGTEAALAGFRNFELYCLALYRAGM